MKNGDRFTCEIKGLSAGVLSASLDYVYGTIAVQWSQVARLESDRAERSARGLPVYPIDEKFVGLSFSNDAVNRNLDHSFFLYSPRSKSVPGAWA